MRGKNGCYPSAYPAPLFVILYESVLYKYNLLSEKNNRNPKYIKEIRAADRWSRDGRDIPPVLSMSL
jgi:hypothetical protein